ncbi:carbohydrate binding family 9 domain-containing protein [bacterium]|nr:carbohydrate binding family 9 domain-containing protein [bacterium]
MRRFAGVVLALAFLAFHRPLVAQQVLDIKASTRSIHAVRATVAPAVDGVLDDPLWAGADWQGGFSQLKPSPGAPARAETRVAVAFDDRHMYVAWRCASPAGPATNSKTNRADGDMDTDNAVTLYLDTFHTRRDCYYFSTNSLGIRVDGRIGEDGNTNDKSWDCAWQVAAREDSAGWSAEMAIPVAELRIPKGDSAAWGVNFRRNYPEYFETSFWQERDTAWKVSQSGDLTGLPAFRKGFSASLYPYLVGLDTNTPATGRRTILASGGSELMGGADLKLGLGSSVNANLTYNPDFATVEADQDQINLTRYETFYPEKRLYFLEGAELFNDHFNVFYSRRVGDLDFGAKSNGRVGAFNYSVLGARERAAGGESSALFTVARVQRDILGASNIGLTAVNRSYDGGYNRVLSTDATFNLPSHVKLTSQLVGSFPSEGVSSKAWFVRAVRETELYGYHLMYESIDPGFRDNVNKVGYIQDDNLRRLDTNANFVHWINSHGIDKVQGFTTNDVYWGYDGSLRHVELDQWMAVSFLNKWLLGAGNNYLTELYEKRFHNHSRFMEGGYNLQSWNNTSWIITSGRNFDREFRQYVFRPKVKLSSALSLSYAFNRVVFHPDPDHSTTNLHILTGDWNFTPDLWLHLFTQYNSRNDRVYVYGLFGWRFAPPFGALYVAYTADRFDELESRPGLLADPLRRRQRAFFVKLSVPVALTE